MNILRLLFPFLIGLNVIIFFIVNSFPIWWTQEEMFWEGFFWSTDGLNKLTLHLGFQPSDFLKPFMPHFVDGAFRTRQISYFLDMVTFKFWQLWGQVFLRNYTLVILHALNAAMVWFLVRQLTKQTRCAWLAALLALNSGIAFATLLFPFRNAKLLVMTFFLLAWIILAGSKGKFIDASLRRRIGFFTVLLLSLLTDEIAFFIAPILFIYIALRDGKKDLFHPRIVFGTLGIGFIFAVVTWGFLNLALHMPDQFFNQVPSRAWEWLLGYWTSSPWQSLQDLIKSFFSFFLRRNFGYWDSTPWGITSSIAAAGLCISIIFAPRSKQSTGIILLVSAVLLVKAIILPHNAGVHNEAIMPPGTVFPSLFFFSYYYVYCEAVLLAVLIGLRLNTLVLNNAIYALLLVGIAFIGISNAVHLQGGPEDALRFHNAWAPYRKDIARNAVKVENYLAQPGSKPVYVSFPTGNSAMITGRRDEHVENMYCHYFPVRYLRDVKAGRMILPVDNTKQLSPFPEPELMYAQLFYDAPQGQSYDLKLLHNQNLLPLNINDQGRIKSVLVPAQSHEVIFFIKGKGQFFLQLNDKAITSEQHYGQAYELFRFNLKDAGVSDQAILSLMVKAPQGQTVQLVGPFIL